MTNTAPRVPVSADRLPVREWASTDPDPAVAQVAQLQANVRLVARLNETFVARGLPPLDIARLVWLWQEHNMRLAISRIANELCLSRPAASRLVERAVQLGLVDRRSDVRDARIVLVRLTTRGRAAVHRLDDALRAANGSVSVRATGS